MRDSEDVFDVGPSLRDATRVAGSNPEIWGDILAANSRPVVAAIDRALVHLSAARELIAAAEPSEVAAWFGRAAGSRAKLDEGADSAE